MYFSEKTPFSKIPFSEPDLSRGELFRTDPEPESQVLRTGFPSGRNFARSKEAYTSWLLFFWALGPTRDVTRFTLFFGTKLK